MAYVKNIWVDQDVERPKTYEVTNNQDGSITLTDSFGLVTELGTPVNEVNMNHIEDGIDGCAIRKHNLTETFNLGEWVLGGTGEDEGIYKSLVANNVGNAITDDTKWEKVEMGGGLSRNVGEIVTSTIPLIDAGLHLLDGALLQYGSYQAFIDYIAGLVTDYPDLFDTEANWQSAVAQYGVCGKFVYDSVSNTVRLPKITGIVEGTVNPTLLGDLVEAGLPNITGTYTTRGFENRNTSVWGSFYNAGASGAGAAGDSQQATILGFDASLSSSLYGNSNTVQPQTIKVLYYIVVATSTKTDIQVDIDEIATDLNGKADVDGSNMVSSVKNFDGQFVDTDIVLNGSTNLNVGSYSYDLSSYLPNDGHKYEVYIHAYATYNSSSAGCAIYSDIYTQAGTTASFSQAYVSINSRVSTNDFTIPVGTGRKIYYEIVMGAFDVLYIRINGYRRIGTNA